MPQTVNELLADEAIKHRLRVSRYSTAQANKMMALLRASRIDVEVRLRRAMERLPDDAWGIRHDRALSRALNNVLMDVYQKTYGVMESDLKALTGVEVDYHSAMLRRIIPASVQVYFPIAGVSIDQVFSAAMAQPFQGGLLSQWAASQPDSLLRGITQQVKMGYIQGETTEQIIRRVNGMAMVRGERDLASVTKSAVSHIASVAREKVKDENDDLIKARKWLSTLDTKTSKMCIIRDGKLYTKDEKPKPMGHDIPYGDGPGQLHFCCRSTETWVIKSYQELGLDMEDLPPGARASMDGQVPADTTYLQWLKRQPQSVQEEVVGVQRAQLLQKGATLGEFFTDKGEWMTLEQLRKAS